jgi:hypothetical protein
VIEQALSELFDKMFVGPVWPASILVCLLVMYTLVALIGLIDLDLNAPDVDLEADVGVDLEAPEMDIGGPDLEGIDVDVSGGDADIGHANAFEFASGLAAATVRWTNFGRVPLIVWMGIFTFVFWVVSYTLWHGYDSASYAPVWIPSILLAARNGVIAVVATKLLSQPLVGRFSPPPGYDTRRLLGATCEISSLTASPTFGQAKFRTNAAPLLLNVRTDGAEIPQGTEVRIIDFDKDQRIYTVTEIKPEIEP